MINKILTFTIIYLLLLISFSFGQEYHWYKGNTHSHTTNSDGNETPRRVVRWYSDHDYNFLVISDHSYLTDITYLDTDKNDNFILIPGEEVTDRAENKPVHLVAIGIKHLVTEQHGKTILETLQNNIDAINAAGGIAQINHPNWRYAFNDTVLSQVKNVKLLEIYNVHRENNNYSAGGYPGTEQIWDKLLSKGVLIYGVVSDDAHDYFGEMTPDKSPPGTGWIMVRSKELNVEGILNALEKGDFYGTVGVVLKDIILTDKDYIIEIEQFGDAKYTTQFIGENGKILKEDYNLKAKYTFNGTEKYVRAKVICSSGEFALTQPVFIRQK